MRTSFARIKLMLKNYVTNFIGFNLCIKVMCISYDIPKIETREKKNSSEKESWKEEEPQLNQSLRATGR
jgi:hypothetical protein